MIKYEIYPIPQNIKYFDEIVNIDKINLIGKDILDEVNQRKMMSIFDAFNIKNEEAKINFEIKLDSSLIRFDEYNINIDKSGIIIRAKNQDAISFALTTLEMILNQSGLNIRSLEINDFASIKYRGIIEGFYGIPWSWENKKELMKFGSKFKNNLFIYAPKDDPYHRDNWRELYPSEELKKLGEMAEYGNNLKNRFVYTIAPFKKESNPITAENIDEAYKVIEYKFEQLYEVGIRQFGVLGDDVGQLPYFVVVDIINRLHKWVKEKGDVHDLIYCPSSYEMSFSWHPEELNAYNEGFPEDVHIFFTGRKVCSPVNKFDIDELKTKQISEEFGGKGNKRRDPFFWLNWPVNDIDSNYRKLYMGMGELLENDVDNIVGLVTNPMQEAHPSKVAIFAVSDYAWNVKDFDYKKSWEDSFKYIDEYGYEELRIIASHMTNQNEKGIQELEESPDFKRLQVKLDKVLEDNLVDEIKPVFNELKNKFEEIIKSIDRYYNISRYEELKSEMRPYTLALKELLISGVYYIDAFGALEEGQKEIGLMIFDKASFYNEKYAYHPINADPKTNRNMMKSETSKLRIGPIIEKIKNYLDRIFANKSNLSKQEIIFATGYKNSKSYRIPALYETNKGTLLAFADKRNDHQFDWGNIDLVLRRKEKNDKDFGDLITIIDYESKDTEEMPEDAYWPVDLDIGDKSAFVIDPVVVQSNKTNRIFALVTEFPESKGFFSIKEKGNDHIEIDGKDYLELLDRENNIHYIKENKIYTLEGDFTGYTVVDSEKQPFKDKGALYKDGVKVGNILLKDSDFTIRQSSHITVTYSDDDGRTWSKPEIITSQVKDKNMKFMGVAPGRGIYTKNNRIIIPAYFTNEYDRQSSCVIYSDDEGKTWKRSKSVNHNRIVNNEKVDDFKEFNWFYQTGECQVVELDNGDIKLILRNQFHGRPEKLQIATSYDGGETFDSNIEDMPFMTQSNCELSVIKTHHEGKEYILLSSPSSYDTNERWDGRVHLLEVVDGKFKYIKSKYINFGMFWYSSISNYKDRFAILYEGGYSLKHKEMNIMYREFNMEYLLENEEVLRYEIYPKPQEVKYRFRSTYLDKKFYIEANNIEESTIFKLKEIIENNGLELSNNKEDSIVINLFYDDKFENTDEYILDIEEDNIDIIASDENSVYYAVMTFDLILSQSKSFLRNLRIHDFSSQKIRGIIEGYYGIPYTQEIRADLMKFISRFKGNAFIYAPKDDPYHREKWYELYPEYELEEYRELGRLGDKIKTRFVWTISPFKKDSNPIDEDNYESTIPILLRKLDQMYDIGIRQFGVLGDDVGALPKDVVVKVMNKVSEWAKTKEESVYDFVFVPEGYVLADWGFRPDELDLYSEKFPKDIQIMFTGDQTCAPITKSTVQDFKHRETELEERRDPLFWLNWPVNDIDRTTFRRLFMGKGEVLHPDVENLVGTLTNPLEEGYASMVAAFAICDYAWNTRGFDSDKSWRDSMKYIEENATNEFFEICKHMSNTNASGTNDDNGGIPDLEESEELKEWIELFEENMGSDNIHQYRFPIFKLKSEYENIANSVDIYLSEASNIKLMKQITPYALNLRDKSLAAVYMLEALEAYKKKEERSKALFNKALELLNESDKHEVFTKTSEFPAKTLKAESGTYRINKNIAKIREYLQKHL